MPKVSIVVCAYKIRERILPTLRSILNQNFHDFELIVIDDASQDGTSEAIKSIVDSRIRLHVNRSNLGVVANRNLGNQLAKGTYIAHCDHDDIWEPSKLEKQVEFLDTHPTYGLVSTRLQKYLHGRLIPHESPLQDLATPNEIRWSLLLDSTFAHSAILYRSSIIREHGLCYSSDYTFADDWDFFIRISQVADIAIIPEALTQYHLGHDNWSIRAADIMLAGGSKLFFRELNHWLPGQVTEGQARTFFNIFSSGTPCDSRRQLREIGDILFQLHEAFESGTALSDIEKKNIRTFTTCYWWRALTNTAYSKGPQILRSCKLENAPEWAHVSSFSMAKAAIVSTAKTARRLIGSSG